MEARQQGPFDTNTVVDFISRYSELMPIGLTESENVHPGRQITGGYSVIYVDRNAVESVLEGLGPNDISIYPLVLGLLGQADLAEAGILQVQQQPYLDLRGSGVLVGIVDTGVDYTNAAFRYEDGTTKIKAIWDQTIPGAAPESYLFGSEYSEADINRALESDSPYSIVPQRDTVGHGTFLAAAAAGREPAPYAGAAPDAELLVVKLRKANPFHLRRYMVPPEQENAFASSDVMLGIEFILERAADLGRPVSIIIGLGTNFGSHDGYSTLEGYMARVAHISGVCICAAAGNEAVARHHTDGIIAAAGQTQAIEVRTGPTPDVINMQIWNSPADRLSVSILSPAGELVGRVPAKPGTMLEENLILERARVSVQYFFPLSDSGGQLTWIKVYDPTPGIWTITLHGDIILEGRYHAWLPLTGFSGSDIAFLSPTSNYTITVPATSLGIMSVGAHSTQSGSLDPQSSWGPTRLPALAPDFTAPGVDVEGTFPLAHGVMSGTSVSAAITAGACALLLQWGVVQRNEMLLNTYLARSYLIRGCTRDAGVEYPNDRWGYGRLNLFNAFAQLRG